MIYTEFPEILTNNNVYETSASKKASIFPSAKFYAKLIKIVFQANRKAVKGFYDGINHTAASLDVLHALESTGVKIRVEGIDNIKKAEGPNIFVANHMSSMETMILPAFIYPIKPVVYVIKEELTTFPLFGKVVSANDPIVVSRKNPRLDLVTVIQEGAKRLKEGKSIIIFPQKTRIKYFKEKDFNSLGVKLAQKNDVYIIPTALLTDAWGNGKFLKDFGKIDPNKRAYVSFGEPFKATGNSAEAHNRVLNFIKEKFKEWGESSLIIS